MKYIKTYENFRKYKNEDATNEGLFGNILNFFKKLWNNIAKEIEGLGKDPTMEKLGEFIESKLFNPNDKDFIFKTVLDEFKKKEDSNNEDCFKLVDDTLDVLTEVNMQSLYDQLLKFYGKNLAPVEVFRFYFTSARNRAITDYKYAGGPSTPAGQEAKIDANLKKLDMNDTSHLPDFKKALLPTGEDRKKKKEVAIAWVEKTLIPRLLKYIQEVTTDQVKKYLESKKIPMIKIGGDDEGGYKQGDTVIYKREKFNQEEWNKLTDDEKKDIENDKNKELQKEQIGVKSITKIDDKNVTFTGDDGKEFTKPIDSILMKIEIKAEGQEELVKKLGELKAKNPDDILKVSKFVDFISDDANKDKISELDKIIGGE